MHPLLEIQRLDTETEQLQHRRANLPVRSELAAVLSERDERQGQLDRIVAERVEALMRQKRLEQEAALVEAKANTDDNRLYSGEVRGIRDLQALQEEVKGLRSRQSHLEDQAISALFEAEELEGTAESLCAELDGYQQKVTVLEAELESNEAEIDEQINSRTAAREQAAALLDAATLARYDRMRDAFGPSTAVEFSASSGCECPNQMPAAEVARIKRCQEGSVEGCSECGRLVIR